MCWNVWSVLNESKLENLLQILVDFSISVACITETWFDSKNGAFSHKIKKRGFEIHHAYREDKRGGGAAILYKKSFRVKEDEASAKEYSSFEFSIVILTIRANRRLVMVCLYRKQEISFNLFYDEFTLFMDKVMNKGEIVVVVGDFNVWIEEDNAIDTTKLLTLMNAYGLNQSIEEPTHKAGHTLDHLYFNEFQIEIEHEVLAEELGLTTDHFPILMKIPTPSSKETTKMTSFRKLKDVDVVKFKQDLEDSYELLELDGHNFKSMYLQYDDASRGVVDQHSPVVSRKVVASRVAWMDAEYRENRAKRRKFERVWKKRRTEENRINYINQKEVCAQLALAKQTDH